MSAAIPAVIGFAITVASVFTGFWGLLDVRATQALASVAFNEARRRDAMADVRAIAGVETGSGTYSEVDVTLTNAGKLSYAVFSKWDVVVKYDADAGPETRLYVPYSATAANNTWRVQQHYLDSGVSSPELVEPGVLNPGEEVVIRIRVSPQVENGTVGEVVISPPLGKAAYIQFNG